MNIDRTNPLPYVFIVYLRLNGQHQKIDRYTQRILLFCYPKLFPCDTLQYLLLASTSSLALTPSQRLYPCQRQIPVTLPLTPSNAFTVHCINFLNHDNILIFISINTNINFMDFTEQYLKVMACNL